MKIHLNYLSLLIIIFAFALPRLASSTTLGLFLEDQIPKYQSDLYSSAISRTKIESGLLTSIGSNSSYVLFGSEGAIYGSAFNSKNGNFRLSKQEFTGVSCPKKSDPTCWKASRIVRTANQWLICASIENDVKIQRYALSDEGKLRELDDDEKEAFFYCPFARTKFLAADMPNFSIKMKISRGGFSIDKVIQSDSQKQVQSGTIEQKVLRLVKQIQYKDETWFVYVSQDKSGTQAKVARVCNSDYGRKTTGFIQLNLWTTLAFLTLECYIPGNPDFVFNEMKDAYFDAESRKVFATFTTSANSIPGSAICQYDIDEIHERFRGERTRDFTTKNQTIKRQVPENEIFYSCRDTSYLPDQAREFLQITQDVKDFYRQQPIFTIMRKNFKFDKINVETVVDDNSKPQSKIFHISTDFGSILKVHYDVQETTSDWLEFYDVDNAPRSEVFDSVLTLESNSLVLTSSDGNILELPAANCKAMSSCRDCFKLSDPRCYWYSSGDQSGCRSGIQSKAESSKYHPILTSDPDKVCPKEPTPVVPVSEDKYTSSSISSSGGGGNVVVVPTKTTPSDIAGLGPEKTSKPKPINLQNKTTFALVVALPTFLVGLTLGMGILFLYAYCKANRSGVSDQGHDQNMYDPEYAKDSNLYEDPPTPQSVMMPPPPKHHNTLPIKTSMGPQYFSSNTNPRGFDKDYDLIHGLNKDMITGGSPISLPNGHVGMPESGLGMMHFHPSNGYMAAGPTMHPMANGNLKGMPNPPPVPRRPRNMSSHSTSSEGIDPSMMMDPAHSSRTPHDENRLIYQVPRGNNRFSSHEYDYGDTNFATIPENEEATPMLPQPTPYHDSEQHNSLRRGQTLPRNGNGLTGGLLPDQHIDDTSEIQHNSLPRQQVERRSSMNTQSNPSPKSPKNLPPDPIYPNYYPNTPPVVLAQNCSNYRPLSLQSPSQVQPQYVSSPIIKPNNPFTFPTNTMPTRKV
ncbi:uncharacterized protein LOC142349572 isoform X2 [Convolutriloba macropyga]|uniref:uncharacterized protein LOC142349572 isoform X2 n=1 Tax=Convolutriloba macropyga TaxID=536237 RepID=UPI003F51FABB